MREVMGSVTVLTTAKALTGYGGDSPWEINLQVFTQWAKSSLIEMRGIFVPGSI